VKRTAIDDTVDQAVLSSLETALDAAASLPLRIRVLEEFIKDPCARLFAKFNHLSTLLSLLNNIAANILLKYQSTTAMIAAFDTEKCIIKTPHHKLVVVHGLQNYIVAEHGNALMICPKEQEQQVKLFVEEATKIGIEFS